MTDHPKTHLPRGLVLTKTKYIGFARTPRIDASETLITGLPEPSSDYKLARRGRWIDKRKQS